MLISHGLCWSRSAESSTPRPRNRWSRTNTTHGTCPFRLPQVQTQFFRPAAKFPMEISWDTLGSCHPLCRIQLHGMLDRASPWHCYILSKEWSILFHHHMREPFALYAQSSCSPGQSCEDVLWPHQVLKTLSSHPLPIHQKIESVFWKFFFLIIYIAHNTLSHFLIHKTVNNACPSYPADEQSSKGLTPILESYNNKFGKTLMTIRSSCKHSTAKSTT